MRVSVCVSMSNEVDPTLYAMYAQLCASAARRRTALTLAIEDGLVAVGDAGDTVGRVEDSVVAAANERAGESAFESAELRDLIPSERDAYGYPKVPTDGVLPTPLLEGAPDWEWALRMGFARDRVMAYACVKAAMFDVQNLSSGPEMQTEQFKVRDRADAWLREEELKLGRRGAENTDVGHVAQEIRAIRQAWERTALDVPDAHRQQPSLRGLPMMLGYTSGEIEALAGDPEIRQYDTVKAGHLSKEDLAARDVKIGTETFVSVVFPASDNRQLAAAGAVDGAVVLSETSYVTPGMVTYHNVRGAIKPLNLKTGGGANAFVTPDAAEVLARAHALARSAERRGKAAKRVLLLLEHSVV